MNPLTESRQALTEALEGVGVTVYPAPPASLTPPAVILGAGSPWAVPLTWAKTEVRWIATLAAAQIGTNEAAYDRLEQLVWDVTAAVRGAGMAVDTVGQVKSIRYGQADVAGVDLEIRTHVEDDT